MKVLVYRKCSTCLKALKWLEVNQVVFDERPIKEEHPSYEELKAWYEMSGLPLKKFFNTSGILYCIFYKLKLSKFYLLLGLNYKAVSVMDFLTSLTVAVLASVICHLICKWLNGDNYFSL